jgi:carbonic anhydrase/acetyltransferase-like protein (isoleucine patch superfamily)
VLERVRCHGPSLVAAGAVVAPGTEIPSGAMALGVPARIRPEAVSRAMVAANVEGYLNHLVQHREGSQQLTLEECITP